jgi:hypothetical protein
MAAIIFPVASGSGEVFISSTGANYIWDGEKWQIVGQNLSGIVQTSGSNYFIGPQTISGSLTMVGGEVIGNVNGTASWSTNAVTASYSQTALTASYVETALTASYFLTSSVTSASLSQEAISASFALTASYYDEVDTLQSVTTKGSHTSQ